MNISDLRFITCPYCGSGIRRHSAWQAAGDRIIFGIVSCACDDYPVVDGILILKKPVHRLVARDASKGRVHAARKRLVDVRSGYNALLRSVLPDTAADRVTRAITGKSLLETLGFTGALRPLGWFSDTKQWASYLSALPEEPESRVPEAVLRHVRVSPKVVLDVGCGITPYTNSPAFNKTCTLLGIDTSYALLFLSRFFFPDSRQSFICADLSHGFPVMTGMVDMSFSLNCFTYLYNQRRTLLAMFHSLTERGRLFLGDMHSVTDESLSYWYPQRPSFYTTAIQTKGLIFDYDALLDSLRHRAEAVFRPYSSGRTHGRYGILFGPKETQRRQARTP